MSALMLLVLALDRESAGQLGTAIELYRRVLGRRGDDCPSALVDLEHLLTEFGLKGIPGQKGTDRGTERKVDPPPAYVRSDDSELLTQKRAAELLGVDPRTVSRWLDRGALGGVEMNGRRRVPRSEIDLLTAGDDRVGRSE